MLNIIFTVLCDLLRPRRDLLLETLALRQQVLEKEEQTQRHGKTENTC